MDEGEQKELILLISLVAVFAVAFFAYIWWPKQPDARFLNSTRYVSRDDYERPRYYTYKNINQICPEFYGFSRPGRSVDSVEHIVHPFWVKYLVVYYDDKSVVSFYYDWPHAAPGDSDIIYDNWKNVHRPLSDNTPIGKMKRPSFEDKIAFIDCMEQNSPLKIKLLWAMMLNKEIEEENRKKEEEKLLKESKKMKLTIKAEVDDGEIVQKTVLEFSTDSLTDNHIDLTHDAVLNAIIHD